MSFLRLFDGDLDLSSKYAGQNLTPNISDKLFSATPLKIYGFDGLATEANGNYFLNGEICNCYPSLEKSVSTSNATLSNSTNFFNADTFYYFKSPSIHSNQSYDSLYAHPDFFKIVEDSSEFSGYSHYINFLLDTKKDEPNTTSYFVFIFDDENNAFKKKYLNYNLSNATLNLSYLFSSVNNRSFSTGLLFKQSNNFFTLDFGLTSSSSSASSFSSSKSVSSSSFNLIYGESGSTLDVSGKTPYEVGVYFKDSSAGDYRGLATNFKLEITNLTEKKYYIFNQDNKTVISDKKCSVSSDADYIYANEGVNAHCHYFNSNNGSTALFTDQKGYAINYGIETQGSSTNVTNSDADATLDSKDADPYGRLGASYSVLTEQLFSASSINFENKIDFFIEGFKYTYDGTDTTLTSSNSISDIPSMFTYVSTLINAKTSETGIRSTKYSLSDDLIFWRPKGGPTVSGYCLVYLSETVKLPISSTTFDYYITPTP